MSADEVANGIWKAILVPLGILITVCCGGSTLLFIIGSIGDH